MKVNEINAIPYEGKLALQQLMDTAYAQAARSFSLLVNQEIDASSSRFAASKMSIRTDMYYREESLSLVVTDIEGGMNGRSYLLLSEQERAVVQETCLPAIKDIERRTVMEEAFIKEIDNIVSAAMITVLSETLDVHMFGGVPRLLNASLAGIQETLQKDFMADHSHEYLLISSTFVFKEHSQLRPQFFWKLPSEFLQYLK